MLAGFADFTTFSSERHARRGVESLACPHPTSVYPCIASLSPSRFSGLSARVNSWRDGEVNIQGEGVIGCVLGTMSRCMSCLFISIACVEAGKLGADVLELLAGKRNLSGIRTHYSAYMLCSASVVMQEALRVARHLVTIVLRSLFVSGDEALEPHVIPPLQATL